MTTWSQFIVDGFWAFIGGFAAVAFLKWITRSTKDARKEG